MGLALILITAGEGWLLMLLLATSLCWVAREGDDGNDAVSPELAHLHEVRQRIADDAAEFDLGAHPRPTRGGSSPRAVPERTPLLRSSVNRTEETLGIREAAAALGSSPDALRAWEARYGYPVSRCSIPGQERTYRCAEVRALAEALENGLSVAAAIEGARAAVMRQ